LNVRTYMQCCVLGVSRFLICVQYNILRMHAFGSLAMTPTRFNRYELRESASFTVGYRVKFFTKIDDDDWSLRDKADRDRVFCYTC